MDGMFFNEEATATLKAWHASLENDKGLRAALRRMTSPEGAFFERGFYALFGALKAKGANVSDERLAVVCGLLAHVKTPLEGKTLGGYLGSGDKPILSEARFKRLLVLDDRDETYRAFIRVLRLAGGVAPIADFANTAYWWNERAKRSLAKEYYRALTRAQADAAEEATAAD